MGYHSTTVTSLTEVITKHEVTKMTITDLLNLTKKWKTKTLDTASGTLNTLVLVLVFMVNYN